MAYPPIPPKAKSSAFSYRSCPHYDRRKPLVNRIPSYFPGNCDEIAMHISREIAMSLQHFFYSGERDGLRICSLEWLSESTNEQSAAMGRWYLGQLENGSMQEDVAFRSMERKG
jgi:hypothetical protein